MSNYVLVHGAFVGNSYWRDVAAFLEKEGHRVVVVEQMPSAGKDPAAVGDLKADTDWVRQTVESVGEPVVLVGHSYGGMVITELADHPAVVHTVYLSAFWPTQGQSVVDLLGGGPLPDWLVEHDDGTLEMTDDIELRGQIECGDVDPERAAANLRDMVPQSVSSLGAPSTAPIAVIQLPTSSASRTKPFPRRRRSSGPQLPTTSCASPHRINPWSRCRTGSRPS